MEEFLKIIKELSEVLTELIAYSEIKVDAAQSNKVSMVDDCLKKEQALVMKFRGFEQKREKLMEDLGFSGKSFQEILSIIEEAKREEAIVAFEGLSQKVQMLQILQAELDVLMKLNIRELEQAINQKK